MPGMFTGQKLASSPPGTGARGSARPRSMNWSARRQHVRACGGKVVSTARLPVYALLRCPRCKSGIVAVEAGAPARAFVCQNHDCELSQAGFPALDGVPVLVDFDNSVLQREKVQLTGGSSYLDR